MSFHRRTLIAGTAAGLASMALAACGGGDDAPPPISLLESLQNDPQLSILTEAVLASGLAGLLGGPGAFTLFAPTNAAFVAFFNEYGFSKESLLNSPALGDILRYHLVDGAFAIAALPQDTPIQTVLGGAKTFSIDADRVVTDLVGRQAAVVAADLSASNGMLHTVSHILMYF